MPPTQTNEIARLRYMTDPLPEDTLVIGPLALNVYAAIDQDDTNWIVILKDVGPDVSVRTARPGEIDIPDDLPERELTRGWLKASHRAVDPARSKPWRPWHPLTRAAQPARKGCRLCERECIDRVVPARAPQSDFTFSPKRNDRQHQMARVLFVVIDPVHHGFAATNMIRRVFDVVRAGESARQIEAGDVETDAVAGLEQVSGR